MTQFVSSQRTQSVTAVDTVGRMHSLLRKRSIDIQSY